ncbi:MAG: hypothetical protein ACX94C_11740 [Phycisphaerales bacterium]
MPKNVPLAEVQRNPGIQFVKDERGQYDEKIVILKELDGSVAAAKHVIEELPAGAVLDSVYLRNLDDSAIVTGDSVGLGTTADPDKWGERTHASNLDSNGDEWFFTPTVNDPLPAAADLELRSTDGSGAAAGTLAGKWAVKITGRRISKVGV